MPTDVRAIGVNEQAPQIERRRGVSLEVGLTSAAGTLLTLLILAAPAAAATAPSRAVEIQPYSRHRPEAAPYSVCPPPAPRRASCSAVVDPLHVTGRGDRAAQFRHRRTSDLTPTGTAPAICAECGSGLENGFSPQDLQSAYRLSVSGKGYGQTVAVVDAYDNPHAEQDLAVYRETYGLPPCTADNNCFTKIDQRGGTEFPASSSEWALEISLDLAMVSAACPNCHILLVEADNNYLSNLGTAVEEAAETGATR